MDGDLRLADLGKFARLGRLGPLGGLSLDGLAHVVTPPPRQVRGGYVSRATAHELSDTAAPVAPGPAPGSRRQADGTAEKPHAPKHLSSRGRTCQDGPL